MMKFTKHKGLGNLVKNDEMTQFWRFPKSGHSLILDPNSHHTIELTFKNTFNMFS